MLSAQITTSNQHVSGAFRLPSMAAGARGVRGATALGRAGEGCSTHFVPVTTLFQGMVESIVRARGSSTAPATLRAALTPTVSLTCYPLNVEVTLVASRTGVKRKLTRPPPFRHQA